MSPIRKLLLVGVGLAMVHSLQACDGETELNPQPLPPQGTSNPGADQKGDNTGEGTSGGSSGSSGATPASDADAGADGGPDGGGDAADAGDH